jgi:hypothetical protein
MISQSDVFAILTRKRMPMMKVHEFSVPSSLILVGAALMLLTMQQTGTAQGQQNATSAHSSAATAPSDGKSSAQAGGVPSPYLVHYESVNDGEPWGGGDRLAVPRQIAAAIIAVDTPSPKMIVDVGSHSGEFLEAFLDKFSAAHAQWTEPVDNNLENAKERFARFGDRVDYRIGCPGRDLADKCVPLNVDVLITSWVSAHRDAAGIAKYYHDAAALLPPGGWLVNLDHIGFDGSPWEHRIMTARLGFHAVKEGPTPHVDGPVPPLDVHLKAIKDAGIDDVDVVWRSFNTVLIIARKH